MVIKPDNPTPDQEAVIDEVAKWIDGHAIATMIAEQLVDVGVEVTAKMMKRVWLNVLEYHLSSEVESAVYEEYGHGQD